MDMKTQGQPGFTLIELLIVIAIFAVVLSIGLSSFISSQQKSRDSARKADLRNIALALETYFNDKNQYPNDDGSGHILGCYPDDATLCPWGELFRDQKGTVYMPRLPQEPSGARYYVYQVGATNRSFQLYARLENTKDSAVPKDPSGSPMVYQGLSCGDKLCNYGVSSQNVSPNDGKNLVVE